VGVAVSSQQSDQNSSINWERVFAEEALQTSSNGDGTLRTFTLAGGQARQGLDIMYAASLASAEAVMQSLHERIHSQMLMGFDLEWVSEP
jgi:hypothetical protein